MTTPRSPRFTFLRRFGATVAGATAIAIALTGCVTNNEGGTNPTASVDVTKASDDALSLLPADVKSAGVLKVGTDTTYAPNQFEAADGTPTGWEVELVEAIASKLELKVEWQKLLFDQIIPQVEGGTLNMGSSSFSDTVERQAKVDFVDFYTAGLQYARGKDVAELPAELCGLSISVQSTTTSDDFLTEESTKCTDAGKAAINVLRSDAQDEATNNAAIGRADYMLADSPITQYGVQQSNGALVLTGDIFDAAPYGLVFDKGSDLAKAVQITLQEMMDDGTYAAILKNWGVDAGAETEAVINGVK